jgi:hypothetical protein
MLTANKSEPEAHPIYVAEETDVPISLLHYPPMKINVLYML